MACSGQVSAARRAASTSSLGELDVPDGGVAVLLPELEDLRGRHEAQGVALADVFLHVDAQRGSSLSLAGRLAQLVEAAAAASSSSLACQASMVASRPGPRRWPAGKLMGMFLLPLIVPMVS